MARGRSPSQRSEHGGLDRSRLRSASRSRSREAVATSNRPRREAEHDRRDRSPVRRKELFPDRQLSSKDTPQSRASDKEILRAKSLGNLREKASRDRLRTNEPGEDAAEKRSSRVEEASHRNRRSSQSPPRSKPHGQYRNRSKSPHRKSSASATGNPNRDPTEVSKRNQELNHEKKKSESRYSISASQPRKKSPTRERGGNKEGESKVSEKERHHKSRVPKDIIEQEESKSVKSHSGSDWKGDRKSASDLQPRKRRRSSPQPSGEANKRGRSPAERRQSPSAGYPEHLETYAHSRGWSPERRYWSPRREAEFDTTHHRPYRGRSPFPRGPSPHHEPNSRWESPSHYLRREVSISPRRDPRRRSPPRFPPSRRSRSPSTHSRGSRRTRSRGGSPDMYNNYPSRGRYPHGPRGYSNSPPPPHPQYGQGHPGDYRVGWSGYGSGSPSHGYPPHSHSPHPNSYPAQSPYHQGSSYGPLHHNSGYVNSSYRGRGGGFAQAHPPPPSSSSRSHFQNLSWTPDKGSRGGVAPSERLPPLHQNQDDEDESRDAEVDANNDSKSNSKEESSKSDGKTSETHKEPRSGPTASASSKTSIKFEMKVQSQPALIKKPNVIQSALKASSKLTPSRPSVFNDPRRSEALHVRTQPPTGPRRDDWRHGPSTRDSRPPVRSPVTTKRGGPETWGRNKHEVPLQIKKRRKRMVKVIKTHRKVVLPPQKLPVEWAQSEFVYYPKPDQQSVVGAGTYGKVFKAHNVYLSKVVALKTLPLIKMRRKWGAREYVSRDKKRRRVDRWVRDGLHLTSLREIKLLKSISHLHQNIVGIREIFLESESCNLVFDYFEFDMHGIIYSSMVTLEDSMLKDLVRQVFQGLDFLHTKANILHRDIKAANILVSTKGQVRITDFGLAKQVKTQAELDAEPWYKKKFEHSNRVITTPYRPPELILGATLYGGEVDVWSAGCVLFEAFLRKLPFQGNGEDVDHLLTVWKILGLPNPKTYPQVLDLEWYWMLSSRVKPKIPIFARLYKDKVTPHLYHLLRAIFQHDPSRRPTAAQVLTHPFFTAEEPHPQSAGAILETVEGEWHELEYKMMRDKERAEARRKHEDNVILCFLKMKQEEHERKFQEATEDADAESAARRVDFYKAERDEYQRRMDIRAQEIDEEEDHAKQVAAIKKSHGDMYMDASRRSRYRGPLRDKVDEKLLGEAWKWYDDEKRKGNDPVPMPSLVSKIRKPEKPHTPSITGLERPISTAGSQSDYDRRYAEYERRLAAYNKRKALLEEPSHSAELLVEKRAAMSPLIDDRDHKKMRDD